MLHIKGASALDDVLKAQPAWVPACPPRCQLCARSQGRGAPVNRSSSSLGVLEDRARTCPCSGLVSRLLSTLPPKRRATWTRLPTRRTSVQPERVAS